MNSTEHNTDSSGLALANFPLLLSCRRAWSRRDNGKCAVPATAAERPTIEFLVNEFAPGEPAPAPRISAHARVRAFRGLTPVSEDKANRILRLGVGGSGVGSTIVSLRQQNPQGLIDHFAISVENFNRDAVTQVLKQHGLTPDQNVEFGFHVKDPDGAAVQIV